LIFEGIGFWSGKSQQQLEMERAKIKQSLIPSEVDELITTVYIDKLMTLQEYEANHNIEYNRVAEYFKSKKDSNKKDAFSQVKVQLTKVCHLPPCSVDHIPFS
jgi:hypothetical protein